MTQEQLRQFRLGLLCGLAAGLVLVAVIAAFTMFTPEHDMAQGVTWATHWKPLGELPQTAST